MPQAPPVEPQYGQPQGQYQQAPLYAPSGGYPLPSQPQGGSFLRGAMLTAAGVAAGSLASEGMLHNAPSAAGLTGSDSDDLSGTDFSDSASFADDSTLADDVGGLDDGGDLSV